jgi:hypothetical protein
MAATFVAGSSLSLIGLGIGGQVHAGDVAAMLWLLPFLLAGFLLSNPARRLVDGVRVRAPVLIVNSASAVALIVRSLVG